MGISCRSCEFFKILHKKKLKITCNNPESVREAEANRYITKTSNTHVIFYLTGIPECNGTGPTGRLKNRYVLAEMIHNDIPELAI